MTVLHPQALFLLPLAVLLGFLLHFAGRETEKWQKEWGLPLSRYSFLHPILLALSCACLITALARPVWDPQPIDKSVSGQDTVFLVDVSRSMDTGDISGGSRLQAVKLALLDLLPSLEGDRIALVAFAGTTVPKCPLTMDYGFFRQSVTLLDTGSTSRGGTLFGDALRNVKKDFAVPGRALAVWAFTDGGDQESFPSEAAAAFGDARISLYIWGVGTLGGGQVPERGVSSSLNESLLLSVAGAVPGGVYYGSSSPLWTLVQEYQKHHKNIETSKSSRVVWKEGSWYLLWPALILFALDSVIRLRLFKKRNHA